MNPLCSYGTDGQPLLNHRTRGGRYHPSRNKANGGLMATTGTYCDVLQNPDTTWG